MTAFLEGSLAQSLKVDFQLLDSGLIPEMNVLAMVKCNPEEMLILFDSDLSLPIQFSFP